MEYIYIPETNNSETKWHTILNNIMKPGNTLSLYSGGFYFSLSLLLNGGGSDNSNQIYQKPGMYEVMLYTEPHPEYP